MHRPAALNPRTPLYATLPLLACLALAALLSFPSQARAEAEDLEVMYKMLLSTKESESFKANGFSEGSPHANWMETVNMESKNTLRPQIEREGYRALAMLGTLYGQNRDGLNGPHAALEKALRKEVEDKITEAKNPVEQPQ